MKIGLLGALTVGFFALFFVYLPATLKPLPKKISVMAPSPVPSLKPLPAEPTAILQPKPAEPEKTVVAPLIPKVTLNEKEEALKYKIQWYKPLSKTSTFFGSQVFRVPHEIQEMVEFWRNVFANFERPSTLLHDQKNLGFIYGTLDFTPLYDRPDIDEEEKRRVRNFIEEERKTELKNLLLGFHDGYYPESKYETFVYQLFQEYGEPVKFKKAAENVRAQWGQKDRFEEGLIRFGRHAEELEKIFESEGVPKEITRLTFVESMFRIDAVSKVGATGPWQFMYETGRQYLKINEYVDERLDPLMAGHAAAKLLKKNYEYVKNWPMAINGYNTGIGRMIKAQKHLDTKNISTIIRYYEDASYQFASRNFYPEFLAVLEIVNNYKNYFGALTLEEPRPYDLIQVPHHTSLYHLAQTTASDLEVLRDLNPSLKNGVYSPYGVLPAGTLLRVPQGQKEIFLASLDLLRELEKEVRWHVVGGLDSIEKISQTYRIPLQELILTNGLVERELRVGTLLKIPSAPEKVVLEIP